MEYYMDEKWKARGKDKASKPPQPPSLPRSISTKTTPPHSSSSSSSTLPRSSSLKTAKPPPSSSSFTRSSSQKCAEFTHKCSSIAKEHKARFYIVKRCICMLVGLKKEGDS
ncbi:hypothetical protein M569_06283 [Genlisea aurea]|uniref:Uncharacterized protein n=1 Tax=Genlisea aurea TaxID=192259 RepID=S8E7S9_9LAMI|nr:hypothetical protein M569_06283 [Genlisea aurea]